MFKHLLVPLDGSKLAEAALPAAVLLSKALGATVTLLHIIEKDAPQEIHGDRHLTNNDDACRYLDDVAQKFFPPETQVDSHVHTEEVKDVARSIVDHSGEFAPDLIVLCAHGEGGWREVMVGSIAQQVIARGKLVPHSFQLVACFAVQSIHHFGAIQRDNAQPSVVLNFAVLICRTRVDCFHNDLFSGLFFSHSMRHPTNSPESQHREPAFPT